MLHWPPLGRLDRHASSGGRWTLWVMASIRAWAENPGLAQFNQPFFAAAQPGSRAPSRDGASPRRSCWKRGPVRSAVVSAPARKPTGEDGPRGREAKRERSGHFIQGAEDGVGCVDNVVVPVTPGVAGEFDDRRWVRRQVSVVVRCDTIGHRPIRPLIRSDRARTHG